MGAVTPGLVLVVFGIIEGTGYDAVLLTLWAVCYAVYAALLSTALPAGR